MDLQSIFYIMSIILMSLSILAVIAVIIVCFYIYTKVNEVQKYIHKKADDVAAPFQKGSQFAQKLIDKFAG